MKNLNRISEKLIIICGAMVLIMFIYLAYTYTTNFPMWDDYDQTLRFMNNYVTTKGFYNNLILVLSQHNEHRIFTLRIADVIYHKIFGTISIRNLIFVSQTLLLITVYILYLLLDRINSKSKLFNLSLATIVVLSPITAGAFTGLGSAMQQNSQILFSVLLILFLNNYEISGKFNWLILYIITFIINGFTGGGWIAFSIAILIYSTIQKNTKFLMLNFVLSVLVGYVYFFLLPYEWVKHDHTTIFKLILFACGFSGSTFFGNQHTIFSNYISYIVGAGILGIIFINIKSILRNKLLLTWFLFFLLNVFLIGLARSFGGHGLDDRYAIYSLINIAIVIGMYLKQRNCDKLELIMIVCLFIVTISGFCSQIKSSSWINERAKIVETSIFYPSTQVGIELYEQSKKLGVYQNPQIDHLLNK